MLYKVGVSEAVVFVNNFENIILALALSVMAHLKLCLTAATHNSEFKCAKCYFYFQLKYQIFAVFADLPRPPPPLPEEKRYPTAHSTLFVAYFVNRVRIVSTSIQRNCVSSRIDKCFTVIDAKRMKQHHHFGIRGWYLPLCKVADTTLWYQNCVL